MAEEEIQMREWRDYREIAIRRRWVILAPVFLCWLLGWGAGWLLPARYRAEALIQVEPQQVAPEYVSAGAASDLQQQLPGLTQHILNRASLGRIAAELRLYPGSGASDALAERLRNDIEVKQEETLGHKPLPAFRVSCSARTPQLAKQGAERLIALFIEENQRAQLRRSERTVQFLADEVEQARQAMAEQESRLGEFKARHLGELPSQAQENMQIATGLQARVERLTASLAHAREQKLTLESMAGQFREGEALPESEADSPELTRLRAELAEARTRYTDTNSYVRSLQAQIEAAEQRRPGGVARAAHGGRSLLSAAGETAAAQRIQWQKQLQANAQEIREMDGQLQETEARLGEYQGRLRSAPLYEQQMAVLGRDYEQLKDNYESLRKKQMQSQLAASMENRREGARFVMLDPPALPMSAYWPNRLRFSLGGLAAGIFLGLAAAAAGEKLGPRIRSEREAVQLMTHCVPDNVELVAPLVMVGIPRLSLPGEAERRRRRLRLEWGLASVLCAALAAANILSLLRG